MSSFLGDMLCSLRNLLSQGFRSLPVLIGSSVLVLGLVQANFNFLFFFVGLFLVVPVAALLLNVLIEFVFSKWPLSGWIEKGLWQVPIASAEQCALFATPVVGFEMERAMAFTVVPSYWMTMIAFLLSYLFSNALNLYNKPSVENAPQEGVTARKSQATLAMILLVVSGIVFTWLRYATTCETSLGILVSWILGGSLAGMWHSFMMSCGLGRLDDMFGISNQLLPFQSYQDQPPTVCVPTPATTP